MRFHPSVTTERVTEAIQRSRQLFGNPGFCIQCGEETEGVEPDASRYECEACGEPGVYGAEELLIMMAV